VFNDIIAKSSKYEKYDKEKIIHTFGYIEWIEVEVEKDKIYIDANNQ
tara:strand:+ start:109 stop:249 length:141 start_codon:yes stop_codon:yes gene_type:complete